MNFDELKKQWDSQESIDYKLNADLEKMQPIGNILVSIRKNIKKELNLLIVSIIFLIVIPVIPLYKIDGGARFFYYFLMFNMLLTSIIGFVRFSHFMKVADEYELNTSKATLMKVYYEFKYALDTYLINSIVATPSGIGLYFIIFSRGNAEKYLNMLINAEHTFDTYPIFFFWIFLLVVISIALIGVIVYYFYVKYYGQRLKEIKAILDDLEE